MLKFIINLRDISETFLYGGWETVLIQYRYIHIRPYKGLDYGIRSFVEVIEDLHVGSEEVIDSLT